jgi:hypothetical protein
MQARQTDASKTVTLKNVRDVLIIYWLFTLEDLMYKVGRLLLRATVGSLPLYRQAISPSSTAHLHSVTPNQTLKSHLHCHSIVRAQVRRDTISPTTGIHSANCIMAHDHKKWSIQIFILRLNIRHITDSVTPCPNTINSDQG